MTMTYRTILLGLMALLVGVYIQLFGFNPPIRQSVPDNPGIEGFFWPEQKSLFDFEMIGTDNRTFGLKDLGAAWHFVFFGYTHCPDICPITMHTLRLARDEMSHSREVDMNRVNFLFVSVDGERDTPEHLDRYIRFFGDNFTALTGNKAQVDSLTTQIGVPYSIDEHEPGASDYLVAHSGAIFLISPEGKLASIFRPPHAPQDITERFRLILDFHASQA